MRWNISIRYFTLAAAFTVLFSLVGCNIFNPDGEGDPGSTGLMTTAQNYLQNGQYAKAMRAFERAIKQDSSNSMAYYGYAKAAVLLYKLDRIGVLNDMQATAEDPTQFSFLQHGDSLLTLRLQAAAKVRLVLGILTDRDTLTRWYRYFKDSTSQEAREDTLMQARRLFIEQYLSDADLGLPGRRSVSKFPLTDFRMPYKSVLLDYTAMDMLYLITRLYDLDRNDTIDSRDALMKKLKFGSSDGFKIDSLSNIAGDLENDSTGEQANNLNTLIAGMQSGLLSTSQLAGLIGGGGGKSEGDSGGTEAETGENLDSVIASMGDAILFYQFGDKLDNDGDGCVDEELMDDKDNDGDGFVDEDARVIPALKPDGVDNDRNGRQDPVNPPFPFPAGNDSDEAPVGIARDSVKPWTLGFVKNFLDTATGSDLIWVKIVKENSVGMPTRMAVQKDSLVVRIPVGGPVPDSLRVKLDNAKRDVGGCWRNYP